ncbi:MAG: Intermediate filament tail domain protein [Methanosaeta sp. PtaU1.Bin060]|nr:MAG: Intermediate filament tail domain protein [Methanosaeta sp. PtaU1.Bin060]
MRNNIVSMLVPCSALLVLFLATALAQGETGTPEIEISIANASFVAPSPESMNLNGEWVKIANDGGTDESLDGWTLMDQQNHTYTFKGFTLAAGSSVKVHTGEGNDSMTDLYWGRSSSVWNNDGDVAVLKDAAGNVVAQFPEENER